MESKICVVIGGTKGIGLEVSRFLLSRGNVVVAASRFLPIYNSKKEINLVYRQCDVKSSSKLKQLFKFVYKKYNRIDVVIVAAGIFEPFGKFDEVNLKESLNTFDVNLFGSMRVCHEAIKYLKKQKKGRIILFSGGGVGGDKPLVNAAAYYVSKVAIAAFSEVLSYELLEFNITVNAVLPGQILTGSTSKTIGMSKDVLGPILFEATKTLQKTGGGNIENTLKLVEFLISEKARKITGRLISAKWDSLDELIKDHSKNKYTLRRIEGRLYKEE